MKVVFFTSRFKNGMGGVEKVVEYLSANIKADEKIVISSSEDAQIDLKKLIKSLFIIERHNYPEYIQYKVWMGRPSSILGIVIYPYRLFSSLISLYRIMNSYRSHLVNYHFPDDSMPYFCFIRSIFRFKYILNIHGNDLHLFSHKKYYSLIFNRLLIKADAIIVNSTYMKDELITRYPIVGDKCRIIPNGIDISHFDSILPIRLDRKYIFYVGRLVHKKGVDLLIRAFVLSKLHDYDLIIEGTGEELVSLKRLAEDLSVSNIKFLEGKLSQEQKMQYMKGAEFGVVPSRIEPFGIVALEYMAAGTPVIASKTGGLEEILKDSHSGLLFKNGDINDMANQMKRLSRDVNLRKSLAQNARIEVQNYDNINVLNKYQELYKEISK